MWPIISTLLLDAYVALLSLQVNGVVASTDGIRLYIILFFAAECACILLFKNSNKMSSTKVSVNTFLGTAVIYTLYIVAYLMIVRMSTGRMLEILFFPLCIIITHINYRQVKDMKTFDRIIDIQFYLLLVVAAIFFMAQIMHRGDYTKNINTVYYVVFTLPFILCHDKKRKRNIGLLIILLCVFWSTKRAPLIAIGTVLLFAYKDKTNTSALKIISRIIMIVALALLLNYIFDKYLEINILDRLLKLGSDGGSGRVELAGNAIDALKNNNIFEWIFGHRLYTTSSVFRFGAHNDFLEVVFRMGLVGFLIYLNFFKTMFSHARECKHSGDEKGAQMIYAAFYMFVIISFSSQLIYLPTYISLIAMAVSLAVCRNRLMTSLDSEDSENDNAEGNMIDNRRAV
ncbi:MAG: O-antigen ligase family protein [Clostridia bacterium]|nr:O-antigen ligase family protein [Clostridia bacterium]